jgi:DNA-binding winged helix-turn-helix (wHTH) protein/tetratricopeptide (TPR) repeat protein
MPLIQRDFYRFDDFELHPAGHSFLRRGEKIHLAPKTFEVLVFLVSNAGRVILKDELLTAVWPGAFVEESNLTQHIFGLRKALADKSGYIVTIPGRGYQFTAPVTIVTEEEQSAAASYTLQRTTERTQVVFEETVYPAPAPWWKRWPAIAAAVVLFAGLVVLAASWRWRHSHPPAAAVFRRAVLADIANTSGDPTFDHILTHEVEVYLNQSPYFSVTSQRGASGSNTQPTGAELCKKTHRDVLLTGGIAKDNGKYRLNLQASDCATGKQLASASSTTARKEGILDAVNAAAYQIRSKLGEPTASLKKFNVPVQQADTASLEAARISEHGNDLFMRGNDIAGSMPFFQKAVELDPNYALAYGMLANAHANLDEYALAAKYYQRAFELSSRLNEHDQLTLRAHYYADSEHDLLQAVQAYQQWIAEFPFEMAPVGNVCAVYVHLGQIKPAIAACEKAVAMRPDVGMTYANLSDVYMIAGRFDDVKALGRDVVQKGKDTSGLHANLALLALMQHDAAALDTETKWMQQADDTWLNWFFYEQQARVASAAGKLAQAENLFRQAHSIAEKENQLEAADEMLVSRADMEISLGHPELAQATLRELKHPDPTSAALALVHAELGDVAEVKQYLQTQSQSYRVDTLFNYVYMPQLKAILALNAGHPLEAIASLEAARPYELDQYGVMEERADAYRKSGQNKAAIDELRKLLAYPGLDPGSPSYNLAHLNLARTYAAAGDAALSRVEYEAFLQAWKDADPNLAILQQARQEFAKLK